jgi:hypothetical protein
MKEERKKVPQVLRQMGMGSESKYTGRTLRHTQTTPEERTGTIFSYSLVPPIDF